VAVKVTAVAERSGGWWAVHVPEVPGVFTQARRLDQVPAVVADAIAALLDLIPADVTVELQPVLAPAVRERLSEARTARMQADELAAAAAENLRGVARALADDGLPERDIGAILGVSHQRAHQLLTDRRAS
jgi:predicted RNase H-like HicB family nuclease